MIKAGCQFKDTGKLYKEWAIEAGIMVDAKERAAKVDEILSTFSDLDTEGGFNDAMDEIMAKINGTNAKQAGALIRSWCKKNEVAVYKKPKGTGTRANKEGSHAFFLNALRDNPHMTEDEMNALIEEKGSKTTKTSWRSYYQNIRSLVNDIAA